MVRHCHDPANRRFGKGHHSESRNYQLDMAKQEKTPRGIRNNNPLNIRIGNTWLGEVLNPTDPEFEQFVNMLYGYRAAFVILRRYIRRYRKNTIATIVSTWAPSSENNTARYIDVVSKLMGMAPDKVIDYEDKKTMVRLVSSMQVMECGCAGRDDEISKAYDMA